MTAATGSGDTECPSPPISPQLLPWYVCLTKPRREAFAVRKFEEQGCEVFLPRLTQWQKNKDAWTGKQQVMSPRHGFFRYGRLGVTGLVTFGNVHAMLDEASWAAKSPWSYRPGP